MKGFRSFQEFFKFFKAILEQKCLRAISKWVKEQSWLHISHISYSSGLQLNTLITQNNIENIPSGSYPMLTKTGKCVMHIRMLIFKKKFLLESSSEKIYPSFNSLTMANLTIKYILNCSLWCFNVLSCIEGNRKCLRE